MRIDVTNHTTLCFLPISPLSLATQSHQWYSWGPPNMQCRLCATCWLYWKKYGGLKMPTQSEEEKLLPSPTTEVYERQSFMLRNVIQWLDTPWKHKYSTG